MGLVSEKNYVVANAVENILAGIMIHFLFIAPKNVREEPVRYVSKKDYGKTPQYLEKIKKEINEEYKLVKEMQQQEEEMKEKEKYLVSNEERTQLIDALKKKLEVLHHEYESIITRVSKNNPLGLKTLKENLEKEMEQIEKDIEKLSRNYIFVDSTQ
jgi:hypothetical protein